MSGKRGVLLSGGQKQRLALARALLIDAPVLLLDDPISQVDTTTGEHITVAIRRLAEHKTVLIVSHRLSILRFAHEIISLDHGPHHRSRQLRHPGWPAAAISPGFHALQELEDAV